MRKIFLILLILLAFDVAARDIDKSITGSWYNQSQSGHGFSVEVLPDGRAVIYWYVYNPDGTPTFLVAIGDINGNTVRADVYHQTGMPFGSFDNSNLVQTHWGTLDFTVNSCNSATLMYSSTMSMGEVRFGSGTIQLTRLSSIAGLKCTASPMQGNMHTTVIQTNGDVAFGAAMLFANGDMVFFGADSFGAGVALGSWRETTPGRFTFNATVYDWDGGATDVSGSGEVFEDGITASYSGGEELIGSRLQSFHRGLTYNDLAGTYSIADPIFGSLGNMTVTANGVGIGSAKGCSLSVEFFIPDPQFNQAYFQLDSPCFDSEPVVGAATYDFYDRSIIMAGSDGHWGIPLLLE